MRPPAVGGRIRVLLEEGIYIKGHLGRLLVEVNCEAGKNFLILSSEIERHRERTREGGRESARPLQKS